MAGDRKLQATLALRAWLELQYRIARELIQRLSKSAKELKWTKTGLDAKPISGLFSFLSIFHDTLNSEFSGKVTFPDFAGAGKTRIKVTSVGTLFPDKEADREGYGPSWWDESASPSKELELSELDYVNEVQQRAQTWFVDKGATSGQEHPLTRCRLMVVDSKLGWHIYLDGVPTPINEPTARLFQAAIAVNGEWISMTDVGCKTEHLAKLPKPLLGLLERVRARGTRLLPAAWSS